MRLLYKIRYLISLHMYYDTICSVELAVKNDYFFYHLGLNFIQHCGLGVVIATAPAWMLDYLGAEQWELGEC